MPVRDLEDRRREGKGAEGSGSLGCRLWPSSRGPGGRLQAWVSALCAPTGCVASGGSCQASVCASVQGRSGLGWDGRQREGSEGIAHPAPGSGRPCHLGARQGRAQGPGVSLFNKNLPQSRAKCCSVNHVFLLPADWPLGRRVWAGVLGPVDRTG